MAESIRATRARDHIMAGFAAVEAAAPGEARLHALAEVAHRLSRAAMDAVQGQGDLAMGAVHGAAIRLCAALVTEAEALAARTE